MTQDSRRKPLVGYLLLAVVLASLPLLHVYHVFAMNLMCYALFACAFNLLHGYTGLLSFGHSAFLGSAAYATGYALKTWGLPTELGIVFGVLAAGALGFVIGGLAIRRSGIYFAMITLALAQMLYFFYLQAPFTGGEDGLQGIPRGHFFGLDLGNDINLYYVVLALFLIGVLLIYRIVHSPFGQVLKAIRENEPRAVSLGYDVGSYKLLAFVLSAALAGLAGSAKALVFVSATLSDVVWQMSGLVILMSLVGGMGTMFGPMVGAFIIVVVENQIGEFGGTLARLTGIDWFAGLGESATIVTGFIFVACVLAFRRGIVGEFLAWRARRPAGQ